MDDGRQAGVVSTDQARYLAEQSELDLVEIAPNTNPPVAKLLDFNKFRYQQEKHARQTKAKGGEMKEIRLSFRIDEHDLSTKAKRAKEFLDEGHLVRAYILLRGRENIFPDKAKETLSAFQQLLDAQVEQPVLQIGSRIQVTLRGKK